jgi:hypothetical protein
LNPVSQSISGLLPRALARRVLASAWRVVVAALLLALSLYALGAVAEEQKPADAAAPSVPGMPPPVDIKIHYLAKVYDEPPPLSLVDPILTDNGVQGARLAIADNNKSGAFLGQKFELIEDLLPADGDVVASVGEAVTRSGKSDIADIRNYLTSVQFTVAEHLHVSYKTVANTCTQLKAKLGVRTLPELMRIAIQHLPSATARPPK